MSVLHPTEFVMPASAPDKSQAVSLRQSLVVQVAAAVATTLIFMSTAGWTFRSMLADRDTRITVLEIHRDDDTQRLKDIQQEVHGISDRLNQEHK